MAKGNGKYTANRRKMDVQLCLDLDFKDRSNFRLVNLKFKAVIHEQRPFKRRLLSNESE